MKTLDRSVETLGRELQLARKKLYSLLEETRVANEMSDNDMSILRSHVLRVFCYFCKRDL